MDLDELTAKSIIEFEEALTLEQTEELFQQFAKELPADITYHLNQSKVIRPSFDAKLTKMNIIGAISHKARLEAFECETIYLDVDNTSEEEYKINAIKFDLIPGYNLDEHPKETVKLWEDVRTQVAYYFTARRYEESVCHMKTISPEETIKKLFPYIKENFDCELSYVSPPVDKEQEGELPGIEATITKGNIELTFEASRALTLNNTVDVPFLMLIPEKIYNKEQVELWKEVYKIVTKYSDAKEY